MNIYIRTDIEGIPGVNTMDDVIPRGTEAYERSCRHLEQTLNWVLEACYENGADNVYYRDGHGGGGNIKPENIDPRAIKLEGVTWVDLAREGKFDCYLDVGTHARAGTLGGFLDHTFKSKSIFEYALNGKPESELTFVSGILGFYDVPCLLCVGDRVGCEQAKEDIPEITMAIVKEGTERNLCHDLPNAEQIIKEATAKALQNYGKVPPYKLSLPITVQQTYYRSDMADVVYKRSVESGKPVERVDARTLRMTVPEVNSYFDLRFSE